MGEREDAATKWFKSWLEPAVVIAIDQAGAAAHGFDNVFLFRSGNVGNRQASFLGHIFELRHRGLRYLSVRRPGLRSGRLGGYAKRKQQAQREDGTHDEESCDYSSQTAWGQPPSAVRASKARQLS